MQVLCLGRAPRTKETLPDFLKWRRVTRHPLVFRRLTGSQRTPENGVSHIHLSIYHRFPSTHKVPFVSYGPTLELIVLLALHLTRVSS